MIKLHLVVSSVFAILSQTHSDSILRRPPGLRYQYLVGADGVPHLEDSWLKLSELVETARYNPDRDNEYHLFTRQNPNVSQPLLHGSEDILSRSNFNNQRKTVIVIHGMTANVLAPSNLVLIPAFLSSGDVNVIAVDWSAGAMADPNTAFINADASGRSVARFINWLNSVSGQTADDIIINGFSMGGQQARLVALNVHGNVSYVSVLDPPVRGGWDFGPNYGAYTEVIHTAVDTLGLDREMGHVHFFPNGGANMPGCGGNYGCNHARAPHFKAESLISGGFTGVECATYEDAMAGTCNLEGRLQMGGITPKTGVTGIYYLETNAAPPFSRG